MQMIYVYIIIFYCRKVVAVNYKDNRNDDDRIL